jgi:cell division protein FtsI (penicillin-binding protein 3)
VSPPAAASAVGATPANGATPAPVTVATGRRRLVNVRERSLLTAKWRAIWVLITFALVALAAIVRLAWLGVFAAQGGAQFTDDALLPRRGEIVDRNGIPLAREIAAYSLWFNPKAMGGSAPLIKSPAVIAAALKQIFPDLDVSAITRLLASGKPGFIRKQILPEEANRVAEIGEPALEAPRRTERYYPQGSMAAHVLGFVSSTGNGMFAMEQILNDRLRSPDGRANATTLSIDARVQGALEDELGRGMALAQAKGGAGIVLDVETGEVLALCSLPSFNPNSVSPADVKLPKELEQAGEMPRAFNRATNQVYELGSTFKPLVVAAAIDAGTITNLARRFPAAPLHMGKFTIHDDENLGSSLNVAEALIHSSNIVSAQIGAELGSQRLKAKLELLGFRERPRIELHERGRPIWPANDNWAQLTTMTVSFGHGVAVSPLHLASAYAALVNGGVWRPATLMRLKPGEAQAGRQVFKPETSATMRQLLRMIAVYGTGRNANNLAPGFRLGGKTGSAEKAGRGGGRYDKSAVIATFAAAFPMDHPRYVVLAMLDEPQKTQATSYQRTAAWNSAPVVGRVIPRIGPMLGIMPDRARDIDLTALLPLIPGKAASE